MKGFSIPMAVFEQLTILAPGLLGASLGMATYHYSLARRIHVWARRAESRESCLAEDWCAQVFSDPVAAVRGSDLVVICTPVDTIADMVTRIAPALGPNALVTDVGSTKSRICRMSAAALREKAVFIGSHPMAGSEKSGMEYASLSLFKDRACLVTPLETTDSGKTDQLVRYWRGLGCEVSTVSPERHDEIVANISHLPHLLASVICLQLNRKPHAWQAYSGNGLRDTTRIAAGSPEIWRSIFEENREELLRSLEDFERELSTVRSHLHNEEWAQLRHLLGTAKHYREELA